MSKKLWFCSLAVLSVFACAEFASAQPGRGAGGGFGDNPILAALDANKDGEITGDEIDGASAALRSLDKNEDGMLSPDELRPTRGANPAAAGARPGAQGRPDVQAGVDRIQKMMDENGGKLAIDQFPERARPMAEQADADKDGYVTKEEIAGARRGTGRPEAANATGEPRRQRPNADGATPGGTAAGGDRGQFIERLFQLDADGDGKLSREELSRMTDRLGARPGGGEDNPLQRGRRPRNDSDN